MQADRHPCLQAHDLACQAAAVDFPVLMPEVAEACRQRVANGSLWDAMYPLKLLELDLMLRRLKPRTCVEIGSGATSLVIRKLVKDHAFIDERPWGTATRIVAGNHVRYAETLEHVAEAPDLLYVDGPDSRSGDIEHPLVSMDAADLILAGVLPRFILFDLRHESVRQALKAAPGRYLISANPFVAQMLGMPWYQAELKIHTLLVRRD